MNNQKNDPKPGAQNVTNQDEQEVVVSHSTKQDGGYDEPVRQEEIPDVVTEQDSKSERTKTPIVKKSNTSFK